jgi:cob(I)alamin adenosyltransferase
MKIYTKTGDGGSSSLYSGERRTKDDAVFAALGDVDELNAVVGVAREHCKALDADLASQLEDIQSRLLDVGSAVATPIPSSSGKLLPLSHKVLVPLLLPLLSAWRELTRVYGRMEASM